MKYSEITSIDGEIHIEGEANLHMFNSNAPLSIRESEFNYLTDFIVKHDLKRGYEIATAFGISALAAGLGFKQTSGKLVSMDCYIEEGFNDAGTYIGAEKILPKETPRGYKCALNLMNHFQLENVVSLEIGWSPDDVPDIIKKHFSQGTLDYVFIDGGHFEKQIIADTESILPFIDSNTFIFYHDGYFPRDFIQMLEFTLNKKHQLIFEPPVGENLCVFSNDGI